MRRKAHFFQSVKKASQSSRPQARKKSGSFSAAACTSPKILYVMQVWNFCAKGAKIMRAAWRKPSQTRTQRSGPRLRACQNTFLTRSNKVRRKARFFCALPGRRRDRGAPFRFGLCSLKGCIFMLAAPTTGAEHVKKGGQRGRADRGQTKRGQVWRLRRPMGKTFST